VLDHFKEAGKSTISIPKLDKVMQNVGAGQFTYDVFKAAYDSDPKIKNLVKNFDQNTITLKQSETDDLPATEPEADNTVPDMAKRATDLGSGL